MKGKPQLPLSEEEETQETEEISSEPVAVIVVDVANVTTAKYVSSKDGKGRDDVLLVNEVKWGAFRAYVERGFGNGALRVVMAAAYLCLPGSSFRQRDNLEHGLRSAGYGVFSDGRRTNLDFEIGAGMMGASIEAMEKSEKVTLVLVTGDGGACHGIRLLRRRAERWGVDFSVWVVSWRHNRHLSSKLKNHADHVTYVEDLGGKIAGKAAQRRIKKLLEEEQAQQNST